jgi:hypothetical protein
MPCRRSDDLLADLLSTIFWAGLETYEGEAQPDRRVVFLGSSESDFVFPEGADTGAAPCISGRSCGLPRRARSWSASWSSWRSPASAAASGRQHAA